MIKIVIRKQLTGESQVLFFNEKDKEVFPAVQKVEWLGKNVLILEIDGLSVKKGRKKS